jgi:hypothetical protein
MKQYASRSFPLQLMMCAPRVSQVIIVDSREGTLAESGNIRRFNAEIYAELLKSIRRHPEL